MTLAVNKTVKENQNSIGSVDKINSVNWDIDDLLDNILDNEKSVFRIVTEVQHYEEDDDNYQESWSDTYKSIIVANDEEEARSIIEIYIQNIFINHYENTYDEIKTLCKDEIHAELCHLDRDTIETRINCGVLIFKPMRVL